MPENEWEIFLREAKTAYKLIGSIPCPAFGGESVYFNKHGWNHLIRKGRKLRENGEQTIRVGLSAKVPLLIKIAEKYSTHRKSLRKIENGMISPEADFWSFTATVDGRKTTFVIRQLKNGVKHFFSVFYSDLNK